MTPPAIRATLFRMDDIDFIVRARHIASAWDNMGGPEGRAEDNLRIIIETIGRLERIVAEHPGRKAGIDPLIERYRGWAVKIREGMN